MPKATNGKKAAVFNSSALKPAVVENAPPDWPTLTPLPHPDDLSIETVLQHQIVTISQFFTASLCKSYTTFLSKLPLTTTPGQPKKGDAVRVNDRFQVHDPAFAKRLWLETGLKELLEQEESRKLIWKPDEIEDGVKAWGLNPNIRIYRYTKGQHFNKHYDESNSLTLGTPPTIRPTVYTLLLYLTGPSDGVVGGETVFYPEAPWIPLTRKQMKERAGLIPQILSCQPERGMLLLHRHGDECLLHEGKEVTDGVKWVIRSDVVLDI